MIFHKGVHWWGRQDQHGAMQLKKRKRKVLQGSLL
jgi:hypothetical protein